MQKKKNITRDHLISEYQRVSKKLEKWPGREEYIRETGISQHYIYKLFDGYNDLARAAGGEPDNSTSRIPDNELFEEMYKTFIEEEGITTRTKFNKSCKYSIDTYKNRPWGGDWETTLSSFGKWVVENHPDFPYMDDLPTDKHKNTREKDNLKTPHKPGSISTWPKKGKRTYGGMLNFRALQYVPTNESETVFLFAMIAQELGFIIEKIYPTEYPDCDAKRCINRNQDLWEPVKIEFEHKSRHFKDQGHDERKCDLIVCWKNNWPDCPDEVIELSKEISKLPKE